MQLSQEFHPTLFAVTACSDLSLNMLHGQLDSAPMKELPKLFPKLVYLG
jgi:hypothetical protein